jgi:hypothetical protein
MDVFTAHPRTFSRTSDGRWIGCVGVAEASVDPFSIGTKARQRTDLQQTLPCIISISEGVTSSRIHADHRWRLMPGVVHDSVDRGSTIGGGSDESSSTIACSVRLRKRARTVARAMDMYMSSTRITSRF